MSVTPRFDLASLKVWFSNTHGLDFSRGPFSVCRCPRGGWTTLSCLISDCTTQASDIVPSWGKKSNTRRHSTGIRPDWSHGLTLNKSHCDSLMLNCMFASVRWSTGTLNDGLYNREWRTGPGQMCMFSVSWDEDRQAARITGAETLKETDIKN